MLEWAEALMREDGTGIGRAWVERETSASHQRPGARCKPAKFASRWNFETFRIVEQPNFSRDGREFGRSEIMGLLSFLP